MPIDPRTRDSVHAFKFEEFQETEIGENKKFLSQSMPPSKPSCLAKKSGRNKKWDTCSGNDGSWMKSVKRKTQPTSTWKKKHSSIYKSLFRSNFATHFLKIKKNPWERYETMKQSIDSRGIPHGPPSPEGSAPRVTWMNLLVVTWIDFFQFQPPWAGHQCSKKSATWKQKSVKKTNENAVLVVVCLNFLRESWFFIREPAVN